MARPSLFSSGSLARGLAELAIIVFGVLIALVVDDWRQEVEERQREAVLLSAVLLDLQADSLLIADDRTTIPDALRAVRTFRSLDPDALPATDSLSRLVGGTYRFVPDRWNTTAFTAIEQSGELRLLRDPQLLRAVSSYYTEWIGRAREQQAIQRAIHDRWVFEDWGDYGSTTLEVSAEDALTLDITESVVARPDRVREWLRSGSGLASLHEVGLIRVMQVHAQVDSARAAVSREVSSYLDRE